MAVSYGKWLANIAVAQNAANTTAINGASTIAARMVMT
jgi:hypothetical protein